MASCDAYRCTDYWHVLRAPPTAIHMVRGGRSDRWPPAILSRLELVPQGPCTNLNAGSFYLHVLPKAGHWLHVDDTDGMVRLMVPHLVEAARKHIK